MNCVNDFSADCVWVQQLKLWLEIHGKNDTIFVAFRFYKRHLLGISGSANDAAVPLLAFSLWQSYGYEPVYPPNRFHLQCK